MLKRIFFTGLYLCVFFSCQQEDKVEKEIVQIPISFEVERFDKKFAKAKPEDLSKLKSEYPFLFPAQYSDSDWIEMMDDSVQVELNTEVEKEYPSFDEEKEKLHGLFQHLKYYYKDFKTPRVITVISQVDYESRVVLADSLLLISLDTYLGKDHRFYDGIQRYYAERFEPSQIISDVAQKYAENYVPKPQSRAFIDYMLYYGKQLYFKKQILPRVPDSIIMGYNSEEIRWAEENERQIWGYFIEEDMLFDTDHDLRRRFFDIGPFTKFGLHLDNESPPQLGQYIGWQIVDYYARKNKDVTLQELLELDNKSLFDKSNYKPKQK